MTDNRERIEALKSQVDAFRFDPGQKRDGDGKWTDGPGGIVKKLTKKVDDAIGRSIEKSAGRKSVGQRFDEHIAREAKKEPTGLTKKLDDAIERSIKKSAEKEPRKSIGQRFDEHVARESKKPRTGLLGKVDDAIERSITRRDPRTADDFERPRGTPKAGSVADTVNRAEKITQQEWDALPQAHKDLMWEDVNDTLGDLPNARAARENLRRLRQRPLPQWEE